ncbi:DNA uptake protein [Endozoicomonas sp. OPT23]|uniref:ComEA family DNA-binding protein n=1 Tax=Endozoicomonas sp. OPT23 TaxID=2072845 RepID=UPI00129B427C|nr:ComEA family DNA-binding protein [Endozoicomonas sp. OPT23]MRI34480.1 DNA uptake protein [Endozoicomonas sp. OPT23]
MKSFLSAIAVTSILAFSSMASAEKAAPPEKVNINKASVQELDEKLSGVGRRIAQEIVKHRDSYGPFQSTDDLDKVKFVGSSIIEKNKTRITYD